VFFNNGLLAVGQKDQQPAEIFAFGAEDQQRAKMKAYLFQQLEQKKLV
jgi:hypothetical protein